MTILKNIEHYLVKAKNIYSITFIILFAFSLSIILNVITRSLNPETDIDNMKYYNSIGEMIIFGIFLAPIIETFLFQYLFFTILAKRNMKIGYIILISSLFFSLIHIPRNFSILDSFNAFVVGLVFGYAYKIFLLKKEPPFWFIVLIHAGLNFIGILLYYIGILFYFN
ncbi:MAG TPA: CPBP family intramembrane metalloprotease [Saprospiraceae bacterium]|nr:CPBP family intramembrane metalloprotease [Saprospiraceae bacterium]